MHHTPTSSLCAHHTHSRLPTRVLAATTHPSRQMRCSRSPMWWCRPGSRTQGTCTSTSMPGGLTMGSFLGEMNHTTTAAKPEVRTYVARRAIIQREVLCGQLVWPAVWHLDEGRVSDQLCCLVWLDIQRRVCGQHATPTHHSHLTHPPTIHTHHPPTHSGCFRKE
jgi:hypothetical protein